MNAETNRVLVVDDLPANREVLARNLSRLGCTVLEAGDGRAALSLLAAGGVDLVLLDLHMPVLDGFGVLAAMREIPGMGEVPVLVVTADQEIDSAVRCIELGARDYLSKPFNGTILRARVLACLDQRNLRKQELIHQRQILEEKECSDRLLNSLFPSYAANELRATNSLSPVRFENLAILFSDVVGFTGYSERRDPEEVLDAMNLLFTSFERITDSFGVEKISAVGDEYVAAAGFHPHAGANPVLACVRAGLAMIETAKDLPDQFQLRVGVHVGTVVGGKVGTKKFQYTVWGDAVNVAARMQSHGVPGAVTVSCDAHRFLQGFTDNHSLGMVAVKGKGQMELHVIDAVRHGLPMSMPIEARVN